MILGLKSSLAAAHRESRVWTSVAQRALAMKPFGIHDLRIIMHTLPTLDPVSAAAKRAQLRPRRHWSPAAIESSARAVRTAQILLALAATSSICPAAHAVDGCTVLLC